MKRRSDGRNAATKDMLPAGHWDTGERTAFAMLAGGLLWVFRKESRISHVAQLRAGLLLLLMAATILLAGCGSGKGSNFSGKSTTYSVTISATIGTETETAAYRLTVQ